MAILSNDPNANPSINPRMAPVPSIFQQFIQKTGGSGVFLLSAALIALLWANSPFSNSYVNLWETRIVIGIGQFALSDSLLHWINDGLMAIFFLVVGLEIKREVLVGELSRPRQALFPVAAALGGMAVPAILYTVFNLGGDGQAGWGIPMATDIAFALGILSLFGRRIPVGLKVFLTAVAIVDDIGAVLVIAVFYTADLAIWNLVAAAFFTLILFGLNRLQVRTPLPYVVFGILLWLAVFHSGVHATVAGILLAATIPAGQLIDGRQFLNSSRHYLDKFEEAGEHGQHILANKDQWAAIQALEMTAESASSPLQRLEYTFHPWVAYFIMPVFALANAGVKISGDIGAMLANPISIGIIVGLVLGKQLGITFFAWLLTRLGWAKKPAGLTWTHIYGAAWLAGIGFTMSLFITNLAFFDEELVSIAKLAILTASAIAAIGGWVALSAMRRKRKIPNAA